MSAFRLAPGTVLADRYEVKRTIARGGMGEVYEALDRQLDDIVALKALDEGLAGDTASLSRFQNEVKSARRISHLNVCRTFEFGVHRGDGAEVHFLTMELLSGDSLATRLQRGPLTADELTGLMTQIARGVEAAHDAGVVHRDLKPSNVMLVTHSGGGLRAVVTDFGIARRQDEATITREGWVGTPAYAAPEQLQGQKVGAPADVYALGVMIFEAASGHLPFEGANNFEVAMQRLTRPAPRLTDVAPSVAPAIAALVAQCLERDPAQRPTARQVAEVFAGRVALSRPKASRRSRMTVALVAVLLAATAGWWWSATLPGEVVFDVAVVHHFEGEREWVGRAAKRLLERRLALERRARLSSEKEPPNTRVTIELTELPGRTVRVTIRVRRHLMFFREVFSQTVEAESLLAALDQLLPSLTNALGHNRPPPPWSETELAEARSFGATSPDGLRRYRVLWDCMLSTFEYDTQACRVLVDELVAFDPGWCRPRAAWGMLNEWTDEARVAAERCRPDDVEGFDAMRLSLGTLTRRYGVSELSDRDPMLFYVVETSSALRTRDDLDPAMLRIFERFPHLQYAAALLQLWQDAAKKRALAREWDERAPEAVARLIARGDPQQLADAHLLYGNHDVLLLAEVRAQIAAFDFEAARVSSMRLRTVRDLTLRRAGVELVAEVATYEGRFTEAITLLELVVGEEVNQREAILAAVHAFEHLRHLYRLLDRRDDERAVNARFAHALRQYPLAVDATLAVVNYDLAPEVCPERATFEVPLRGKMDERHGVTAVLRAAQLRGCTTCDEVMSRGWESGEFFDAGLFIYARCAQQKGELELALRVLDQLSFEHEFERWARSPIHVILASFERARVLEALGRKDEARRAWTQAAHFWQQADRPRPEVKEAREALERLK